MLRSEIGIDPITRLPNLFGLLEVEHNGTMGGSGRVLAVCICPAIFADQSTPEYAEACIQCLALLLDALVKDDRVCYAAVPYTPYAFRVGHDEFVVVIPNCNQGLMAEVVGNIRTLYHDRLPKSAARFAEVIIVDREYNQASGSHFCILKAAYQALAMCSNSAHLGVLPAWEETLIDQMAEHICITLTQVRETRTLALTDEVSGLFNSRAAQLYLDDMLHDYQMQAKPCSVLLADGDNLRHYNESGYQSGNQMIHDLSSILRQATRAGDYVTRWLSGDEFLILLPGANEEVAKRVAERLRVAVQTATIAWPIPVTISIGVATCPNDGTTAADLIACVEERIFTAKKAGKNQVV